MQENKGHLDFLPLSLASFGLFEVLSNLFYWWVCVYATYIRVPMETRRVLGSWSCRHVSCLTRILKTEPDAQQGLWAASPAPSDLAIGSFTGRRTHSLANELQNVSLHPLSALVTDMYTTVLGFYVGARDPHLGPHAYMVDTLLMSHFPSGYIMRPCLRKKNNNKRKKENSCIRLQAP